MGPASTWQLLVLISWGGTGWKPTEMLSPSQFIFALYSISSHSASNNSAANKGCLIQTLYLLVLIMITGIVLAFGIAMHQLITMPSGRLWCSTCSTRHVILGGSLLVHPCIVMVEFVGMQIGCCLVPIVTWPINPSFLIKDGWAFFSQVSWFFRGYILFICLMINRLHSIIMIFCDLSVVIQTELRK